jgi:chemotaxis protein CheD
MSSGPGSTRRARAVAAEERLRLVSSPEDGLAAVAEILSQLFGSEEYALLAMDTGGTRLRLVASRGIDPTSFRSRSIREGLMGRVARRGAAFLARRSSRLGASADEASLTACIPLMDGGKVAGVLAIFRLLPHKRGFDAGDTELLDLLSAHGAIALRAGGAGAAQKHAPPEAPPAAPQPPASSRVKSVYLYPGDAFVSEVPIELSAILGSCVAVCVWDPDLKIGGMSHYLLPTAPTTAAPGPSSPLRFGDTAIPSLLASLERLGSRRQNLRAKLFGGATVNAGSAPQAEGTLGLRNVEIARSRLAEAGILIAAEDVGGAAGRKLRFRTDDGTALVKALGSG